ncbi:MAG: hypothetical protein U1F43_11975 [Myxococcota bacterium]
MRPAAAARGAATADEAIAGLLAAARAGDVAQAAGLFPSAAVLASALSCPSGSELAGRYGEDAVKATLKAELAGLAGLGLARRAPERDASETVAVGAELGGCRATAPLRLEKVGVVLRDGGGREAPEVLRFAVIGERWYLLRL